MTKQTEVDEKIIPESLRLAAAEIAAVCKKHGLRHCSAKLLPEFKTGHDGNQIELFWDVGRHGADAGTARLHFHRRIIVDVESNNK